MCRRRVPVGRRTSRSTQRASRFYRRRGMDRRENTHLAGGKHQNQLGWGVYMSAARAMERGTASTPKLFSILTHYRLQGQQTTAILLITAQKRHRTFHANRKRDGITSVATAEQCFHTDCASTVISDAVGSATTTPGNTTKARAGKTHTAGGLWPLLLHKNERRATAALKRVNQTLVD